MRGVTVSVVLLSDSNLFQLTRLMRGVTTAIPYCPAQTEISTHTPHARRDFSEYIKTDDFKTISTHTPHARRDKSCFCHSVKIAISTHTPHARRDGKL